MITVKDLFDRLNEITKLNEKYMEDESLTPEQEDETLDVMDKKVRELASMIVTFTDNQMSLAIAEKFIRFHPKQLASILERGVK